VRRGRARVLQLDRGVALALFERLPVTVERLRVLAAQQDVLPFLHLLLERDGGAKDRALRLEILAADPVEIDRFSSAARRLGRLRARATSKARGIEPRITAVVGAFLVYVIPLFPRRELSVTAEMVSTLLVLFGSAAAVIALVRLGRSFSMMSEARRLVTSGPYRFVRHPLYLAEELAIIGISLQFFSLSTALVLAVQIAFQLRRMRNEEAVLTESFAEYAAYRQRTARLLPGIY